MKTIQTAIKLAFVALVANATWQLFNVYSPHFKFREAVQYAAQYRGEASDADLRQQVLQSAIQFDVPVAANDVTVSHENTHTTVTLSYVRPVELAPGFIYPWAFSLNIDTYTTVPPKLQDLGVPK